MSKSSTTQPLQFLTSKKDWQPHKYQERAMAFLLRTLYAGLILDPGLGKTSISLGAIQILLKEKSIRSALVVAPLRVCHLVWPAEVEKWKNFEGLKVVVLHGPDKEKLLHEDADVWVINPEGLKWLLEHKKRRLEATGADLLVVDESTKFKSTQSQRFKLLKPHLPKFRRRWILTGTPAPNGLMDLFGQAYVMDRGYALGQYITHYRATYFEPAVVASVVHGEDEAGKAKRHNVVQKWVPTPTAEARIYEKLKDSTLRMAAEDYLELPRLVENDIWVELPAAAMKTYRELEDNLVTRVRENLVTAANAAVAMGKCRQVAGGAIYKQAEIDEVQLSGPREFIDVHEAKLDALEELVESLQGSPVLVAYEFQHELFRIRERLGDVPYIGSGVTTTQALAIERAWNNKELPVLLGHPGSMGHGLNLQAAGNHVCWYTPTWNLEHYDQFNKRVLRQGNTHDVVMVHRLLARSTIDRMVAGMLKSKGKTQTSLLAALKQFTQSRG